MKQVDASVKRQNTICHVLSEISLENDDEDKAS